MPQLDPEQWAEVQRLFDLADALPPRSRGSFLESECADEAVRREVQSLLEYPPSGLRTAADAIASAMAAVALEADPDRRLIGAQLGPYRVESIVGQGGMGAVYRASREDAEFRQQVAIKLVRAAAQSPATLRRFKRERQILANLAHPNIARLLDGGSTPDGMPYLVMEFIQGEAITAWCKHQSLSVAERLRLFLRVCEGVESAHRNLVIHRDLKPGNILVTKDGTPKLLDFGIAKMLEPDAEGSPATTMGMRAMTPEYAAPEQVRGEPVSQAADVYALGLVLYEILTGRKAQDIPTLTPDAVVRAVCQTEPIAPAALNPELAGDLDIIIRKAIRKEPERRYASVADLARDIQLHLDGRPVTARSDTVAYRAMKFLGRNRATVAAFLTAIVFGGVALIFSLGIPGHVPRVLRVTQVTTIGHVEPGGSLATDGSYVYFVQRKAGNWLLARVPVGGGPPQALTTTLRYVGILDISPDRTKLLVSNGIGEDVPLWIVPTQGGPPRPLGDVSGHNGAWSRDGKRIIFALGSSLFVVNVDGSGVRKVLDVPGKADNLVWSPAPGRDTVRFTIAHTDGRGSALWEAQADGTRLHPLLPPDFNSRPVSTWEGEDTGYWISGGKYFLFRSMRAGVATIWARKEGRRLLGLSDESPVMIYSTPLEFVFMATGPNGKRVFFISGQEHRQLARYDAVRGEFAPYLPGVAARWVSFSRDGLSMAYEAVPEGALWRSRPDGTDAVQLNPPAMSAFEPNWSPDGAWIVFTAGRRDHSDGVYVIPSSGGAPERLTSPTFKASHASWSPDGSTLLFRRDPSPGAADHGLFLIDWKTRKTSFLPGSDEFTRAAWSPDGQHIAATAGSQLWIFEVGTQRWTALANGKGLSAPFWSANGKYVYYEDSFEFEQPIFRVPASGGKSERMMTSRQIPQSDTTLYSLAGLAPGDMPIASMVRADSDIYALELELP